MKKLVAILSAFALTLSLGAQMNGNGDGTMDGSGPHGYRNMWENITTAINQVVDADLKAELQAALAQASEIRETLRTARAANPDMTIEEFRLQYTNEITALKQEMEKIMNWWREARPDRPDPVVTGEMQQRRNQFQTNSQNILQTRRQLRLMEESDENYNQVREQLRLYLGERKQLMRDKRRGEGGPGGEGNGGSRGG